MKKRVYVSADWKEPFDSHSWDKEVVDRIRKWNSDSRYAIDLKCTDDVHNSVVDYSDCRRCDIKEECSNQIKNSDVVIFVVGDNTSSKKAGACDGTSCSPAYSGQSKKFCKYILRAMSDERNMSYLQYEISTAVKNNKKIILVYNSVYRQDSWIPSWYTSLKRNYVVNELCRVPFWKDANHSSDCYQDIKGYLI